MNPRQPHTTRSEARSALLFSLLRYPSEEVSPVFVSSERLAVRPVVRCRALRYIQPPGSWKSSSFGCGCSDINACDCNDCEGECSHRKSAALENLEVLETNPVCEGEWPAKGVYPFWEE